MKTGGEYTTGDLLRFYLPLALQFATMNLTFPIAGMVASAGPGGVSDYAGLIQAQQMMNFISTLGFGMMVTGMVHGKTIEGLRNYQAVNRMLMIAVIILQSLVSLTPLSHLIMGKILGMPVAIEKSGSLFLAFLIPFNFFVFTRNRYMVALYLCRESGKASIAAVQRIASTFVLSLVFRTVGLTGPLWAAICVVIPVAVETLMIYLFARKHMCEFPKATGEVPGKKDIFFFNIPLSAGGIFLNLSSNLLAAFIARAADPEKMLPVYYLAQSLVAPMTFATNQLRTTVLTFPPKDKNDKRTLKFAAVIGLTFGLIPLIFIIPGPAEFYYVHAQNLDPALLNDVRITAVLFAFLPLCTALRFQSEGLAANLKSPVVTLAAQAVFLGMTTSTAFITLSLGFKGNIIGPLCSIVANICAMLMIRFALDWSRRQKEALATEEGV
ncbi:MAG: hypothetical protein JNL74_01795 [Fibrobacteres bacterium]|nr:hypothetical protein [Fibrobacterota bacterium]